MYKYDQQIQQTDGYERVALDAWRASKIVTIVFLAIGFSCHNEMDDIIVGYHDCSGPDTWYIFRNLEFAPTGNWARQNIPNGLDAWDLGPESWTDTFSCGRVAFVSVYVSQAR